MYFVLDTNVLVSAILKPNSVPDSCLRKAQNSGIILFSEETKIELLEVISRNKFDKYFDIEFRLKKTQEIIEQSNIITISNYIEFNCRDNKDIKFLQLAFEAKANYIISGDIHLTELHPFHGISILNPIEFNLRKLQ